MPFFIRTKSVLIRSFLNTIGIILLNDMFLKIGALMVNGSSHHSTPFSRQKNPFDILSLSIHILLKYGPLEKCTIHQPD